MKKYQDLSNCERYYVESQLVRIQDLEDEKHALLVAREDALLSGAVEDEIFEIDWLLAMCERELFDVRIMAN